MIENEPLTPSPRCQMGDSTKMRKKKKISGLKIFLTLVLLFILWSALSWLPVTEKISLNILKEPGEDVRIVLVTDLHSCKYGKDQKSLIKRIDREKPDLVLMSGDIFDDRLDDANAKAFIEGIAEKYPCYYVTGNHEFWSGRADEIKTYLKSKGVKVLEGGCESICLQDHYLDICGIDDPDGTSHEGWVKQLEAAAENTSENHCRILLSHRPERVAYYERYDFDLILAGHAHAGQFRIPFINRGLIAPNQGLLAKYVNGTYELSNGSVMEVSRGLARESTPLPRFFNHPEIVVIDLEYVEE